MIPTRHKKRKIQGRKQTNYWYQTSLNRVLFDKLLLKCIKRINIQTTIYNKM